MINYFVVALGGAVGATGRFWIMLWLTRSSNWLPWGTLFVNASGSFAIGILWAYLQQRDQNELLRLFVSVGFLGGFTTFSTFSLETIHLLASGETLRAIINMAFNLILCLLTVALGLAFGRWVL